MIFIVGTQFSYKSRNTPTRQPLQAGSIQEQLVLNRQPTIQKGSVDNLVDNFIVGNTYKITRIKKITVENVQKVEYLFTNLTNSSISDFTMVFTNTHTADDYIAAISGYTQKLQDERKAIQAANSNSDI